MSTLRVELFITFHFRLLMSTVTHPFDHYKLKKKATALESVNTSVLRTLNPAEVAWDLERAGEAEAEMDEMWSFVGHKGNPRWLWHAIDHHTGKVLAYVFGRRKDDVFLQLKALLEPFGLTRYYTDYWGAYTRHLDPDEHCPGKRNTQKIERTMERCDG